MSNESDASSSPPQSGEERSVFLQILDALESLRWLLIKSVVAIAIGMVICLAAGNYVVNLLKWPLLEGERQGHRREQQVVLQIGTNEIFRGIMPTNVFGDLPLGSNHLVPLQLVPITVSNQVWIGLQPGDPPPDDLPADNRMVLKTLGPMAAFTVAIDLAIYGGIGLAAPFIFFFIGQFAKPFLKEHVQARRLVLRLTLIMAGLFVAGVVFCYFILLPIALYGSVGYARWLNFVADTWKAEDYISFVCKFCLGMGVGFELPVLLLALVKMGVLNYERLRKFRAYWLVINLVASAAITPDGNPLTMALMAAPLQILFELSVWVAGRWERKAQKAARAQSTTTGGA